MQKFVKNLGLVFDLPWFLLWSDNGNLVSGFPGDSRQFIYSFDLHILFDRYIKTTDMIIQLNAIVEIM